MDQTELSTPPEKPKAKGRLPYAYYWVPLAVLSMLSLMTPKNVLDQWPLASAFTEFMAAFIPQIDHIGAVSRDAAQANRFVSAVSWAVSPLYVALIVLDMRCNGVPTSPQGPIKRILVILGGLAIIYYSFFSFPTPPHQGNWTEHRMIVGMFISNFGRAIWVPLFAIGTMAGLLGIVIAVLQKFSILKTREANHGG